MAQDTQYGGFWARLVATILDSAVVFLILLAIGILAVTAGVDLPEFVASLLGVLVPLIYWPAMESSSRQATFGKRIMGLEVTSLDGNRLSFLRAFLRYLAKIISAIPLGIGFLLVAFHARKQGLHDIIVKSLVVRTSPSQLWKVVAALIVGLVLMVASAAGLFYFVVMPMFKKGVESAMKDVMKGAPPMKSAPAPGTVRKAPPAQAKPSAPAAPAAPAAGAAAAAGKQGPDPEFDAIVGKPLTGLEKPGTTRAGPAILELSAMFPTSVWVKVHMPMPSLNDPALMPGPTVTVNRVLDAAGNNYHDMGNTFEQSEFFRRPQLSTEKNPVPHLSGTRTVHLRPGLSEQNLQRIEGQINFRVPVDPKTVAFDATETAKPKSVHDAAVTLQSVTGNAARLQFRGPSETLLQVRGFGADGKPLAFESRQTLPENQDVDQSLTITFKAVPAKVEAVVAARIIERFFPYSLARGASAGPAAADAQGYTLPARPRAAPPAAPAPAAAPAAAAPKLPATMPAKPEPRQEMKKPEAKAVPKPVAAPTTTDKRTVRRSRANEDARECLLLSTHDEIIKCAEKFR